MLKPLNESQMNWIEKTFAWMTTEQKVGQLLCPDDRNYTPEQWQATVSDVPVGSVFFGFGTEEQYSSSIKAIQDHSAIPVLIASDFEHGPGAMIKTCTDYPWGMALGAVDAPELMNELGAAIAREARSLGVHWNFAPVVDVNMNFNNPVVNTRSMGDEPQRVANLASEFIKGMQADCLMAAAAKHFPGDGTGDRDQHFCTSPNILPMEEWWKTFGMIYRRVIEAGVMSIMCGHISLPAYQGFAENIHEALPATLSRKLQIDLLRQELDFEGVIVSDALVMSGITSRVPAERVAVENIASGSDVALFVDPRKDFEYLMLAVEKGEIPAEQLDASVRRILEMKARLNLHKSCQTDPPEESSKKEFEALSMQLSERSITVVRNDGLIPSKLERGDKVLTVTIKYDNENLASGLEVVDEELRSRGLVVDHLLNPSHRELIEKAGDYKRVFVNLVITPHSCVGTIRLTGKLCMTFWRSFWVNSQNAVFTSFGSPYHLYEYPNLPNMVLAYGPAEMLQKAAVKAWLGEIEITGVCPVELPL